MGSCSLSLYQLGPDGLGDEIQLCALSGPPSVMGCAGYSQHPLLIRFFEGPALQAGAGWFGVMSADGGAECAGGAPEFPLPFEVLQWENLSSMVCCLGMP